MPRTGVKAAGVGVRWDGTFDPVDCQAGHAQSEELYERLPTRLWERDLRPLCALTADGTGGTKSAQPMACPEAQVQLCLWHWEPILEGSVQPGQRRRLRRGFWETLNGLDPEEVQRRAIRCCRGWQGKAQEMMRAFRRLYPRTLARPMLPGRWRHRLRTVHLA